MAEVAGKIKNTEYLGRQVTILKSKRATFVPKNEVIGAAKALGLAQD